MPSFDTALSVLGLWALVGYLLGAMPFGLLVARLMGLGDLRKIGSGNIGATNVLRTGNRGAAALTLLLDAGKGVAAVLLAGAVAGPDAAQIAGLGAFIGHLFPIWLGFRGGKGVATFLGVFLGLSWQIGLALCAIWLVVALVSRISSLAALAAVASLPVLIFVFNPGLLMLGLFLSGLIYIRHADNIRRLKAGTETKIGQS